MSEVSDNSIPSYDEFVASKVRKASDTGFEPKPFTASLFEWQKRIVTWAVKKGRCALFEDCGLGKTIQQIEWANQVQQHTGGLVLILCPLSVAQQTQLEAERFGFPKVHRLKEREDVPASGLCVCNYDRLDKFEDVKFAGVVLDESSILKSFDGKLRRYITDRFSATPYRLCCTATPAPNDFTELGQHADFLGICSPAEMLATYFINDTFDTGTWRLKGHAEDLFWEWVSSWAVCISKPSDIGFDDAGFALPPVNTTIINVEFEEAPDFETGELFKSNEVSATELHSELRKTMKERVEAAANIVNQSSDPFVVWCEANEESELLASMIPDAVEVTGSMSSDVKERNLLAFSSGQKRVIVSKPKLAGFGLNWQHCWNEIFVGLSHSFEKMYQAGKRIHRFGQKKQVNRYIVQTRRQESILKTVIRKQIQHESMRALINKTKSQLEGASNIVTLKTDIESVSEGKWTVYNGDCVRVASTLADESIGFSVFSPPFADLFTYSSDIQDMGNCGGLDEFMVQFGYLIDQLQRVTMPGRECAVHCCDLLATKWKDGNIELKDFSGAIATAFRQRGWLFHSRITIWKSPVTEMQRTKAHGLLYKTLRTDSSKSRVGAPDYLLVFKKKGDNPKPITHDETSFPLDLWQEIASPVWMTVNQGRVLNGEIAREDADERHICPLQLDVIERALHMWSAKDDVVFSPFTVIGSEGFCSVKMGRRFVGSELKTSYWKTAIDNLRRAEVESKDLFQ